MTNNWDHCGQLPTPTRGGVGDSLRDLQAMHEAGGKTALVLTGKGKKTLSQQEKELPENTQIFDNLLAFSQYIMHETTQDCADGQANP